MARPASCSAPGTSVRSSRRSNRCWPTRRMAAHPGAGAPLRRGRADLGCQRCALPGGVRTGAGPPRPTLCRTGLRPTPCAASTASSSSTANRLHRERSRPWATSPRTAARTTKASIIDGACGIAMRRLSIIDLAGGHQPLSNVDQTIWLVCNGEIYNYRELRAELQAKGHHFKTGSDSEVLIHLYDEEGDDFVHRLNGMFDFALVGRAPAPLADRPRPPRRETACMSCRTANAWRSPPRPRPC
jgi:hypothetical protein